MVNPVPQRSSELLCGLELHWDVDPCSTKLVKVSKLPVDHLSAVEYPILAHNDYVSQSESVAFNKLMQGDVISRVAWVKGRMDHH
jgi:hypothetical protein